MWPLIESINNQILTGELYKALREVKKLISYEQELLEPCKAIKAYAAVAKETASPRDLEALLLLKSAFKLQSVYDGWADQPHGLDDAVLYNRRLWTVFLDSVCDETSLLPLPIRQNIANIGIFVMTETFSLMTDPRPSSSAPADKHQPRACRRIARQRLRRLRASRIGSPASEPPVKPSQRLTLGILAAGGLRLSAGPQVMNC